MRFRLVRPGLVNVPTYNGTRISTGDEFELEGRRAERAQNNPDYERVGGVPPVSTGKRTPKELAEQRRANMARARETKARMRAEEANGDKPSEDSSPSSDPAWETTPSSVATEPGPDPS